MPWMKISNGLQVGHAAQVLDFQDWLARLASRAVLPRSRKAILALLPSNDRDLIEARRLRVKEWLRLLEDGHDPQIAGVTDPGAELAACRGEGSCLGPEELYGLARSLRTLEGFRRFIVAEAETVPVLRADLGEIESQDNLARRIEACVGPDGDILDGASFDLARIRRSMGQTRDRVRGTLEDLIRERLAGPGEDPRPTLRSGRLVLPVKRERRSEMPGIVHDESGTRRTLFVEPMETVELNNRVAGLVAEEREEIARILDELSARVREASPEIEMLVDRFSRMEIPLAISREFRGRARSWATEEGGTIRLIAARHPLLEDYLSEGVSLVPLDLEMDESQRLLLVSGPNTGGKTVMLKTLGLMAFLNQIGAPLPAGDGCVLPLFDRIFADIGDEQSLRDSQSTFSAHLIHLVRMVEEAGPSTLILVDEIGDGTDPEEGTALARASMERWIEQGARVLITTHLGGLKGFAQETEGAANASMEFDPEARRPLYVLRPGVPGGSRAMATARRLGLNAEVLERAESLLGEDALKMDALLTRLEEESVRATEAREAGEVHRRHYERLEADYEKRMRDVRKEQKRLLADSRREGLRFLEEARSQLEAAVKEIRERQADRGSIGAAHDVVKDLEKNLAARDPETQSRKPLLHWRAGDRVRMLSTGKVVEIIEEAGSGRLRVSMDGVVLVLSREDLTPLDPSATRDSQPASRQSYGIGLPSSELESFLLDLRGHTVDEALDELDAFLDAAILGGYEFVEILHGKGTGALRQAIRDKMRRDSRVRSFRLADQNRGGSGVTRIDLAGDPDATILRDP
jgi:DNA mismatch repair protein MutS2